MCECVQFIFFSTSKVHLKIGQWYSGREMGYIMPDHLGWLPGSDCPAMGSPKSVRWQRVMMKSLRGPRPCRLEAWRTCPVALPYVCAFDPWSRRVTLTLESQQGPSLPGMNLGILSASQAGLVDPWILMKLCFCFSGVKLRVIFLCLKSQPPSEATGDHKSLLTCIMPGPAVPPQSLRCAVVWYYTPVGLQRWYLPRRIYVRLL